MDKRVSSMFGRWCIIAKLVLVISSLVSCGCSLFDHGDEMEECYFIDPDTEPSSAQIAPTTVGPAPARVLPGPAAAQ